MRLFSYTIRYDYGSAPNPYWGVCTLTICKPVVRRNARVHDWVVGLCGCDVVYAMKVNDRKTLREYDHYCRAELNEKIPSWSSRDFRRRVGDCIYDYSNPSDPILRKGIHQKENVETDLSGLHALLSRDFYYFGSRPIPLPPHLHKIIHKRGHKSTANDPYKQAFIRWIRKYQHAHNKVIADPKLKDELIPDCRSKCSRRDREEAEADERQIRHGRC